MAALSVEKAEVEKETRRLRRAASAVNRARGALAGRARAFDNQGGPFAQRVNAGRSSRGEDGDGERQG